MIELSTEMARVAEVDRGILWDEEGNWPEVLKSRACSRECPVVWPLWTSGLVQRHSVFEWLSKHNTLRPKPIIFVKLYSEHAQSDGKSVNRGLQVLDLARGRDSWCWPKGARPLGTRMICSKSTLKNRFFSKRLKINKHCENWNRFLDELCLQVGMNKIAKRKISKIGRMKSTACL